MAEFQRQRAEETYYRSVREAPLGRGFTAGALVLPEKAAGAAFAFGVPTGQGGGTTAKDLVAPLPPSVEETAREALYERSHHAHGPGVQRTQALDWAAAGGASPTTSTFGRSTRIDPGVMSAALGRDPKARLGAVIVPKAVQVCVGVVC